MKTPRIAFLINKLNINGTAKSVFNLATFMGQQGCDVHVITKQADNTLGTPQHFTLHALSKDGRLSALRFLNQHALRKQLKKQLQTLESQQPFDLIISSGIHAHRLIQPLNRPNAHYWIHAPISHELALIKTQYRKRRMALYRQTLNHQHLICVSQGVADDLNTAHITPHTIRVIYNMLDFTALHEQAEQHTTRPDEPYLIHVGRYSPEKRHDLLLQAYAKLNHPPKLILLTTPHPTLTQLIQKHQLESQVIITGYQNNPYPWIAHAKLLISCSDYEGFGLVLVEALALNTPVVTTSSYGGIKEVMSGTLAHNIVTHNDPQALANKIQKTLDNPSKIDKKLLARFDIRQHWQHYLETD